MIINTPYTCVCVCARVCNFFPRLTWLEEEKLEPSEDSAEGRFSAVKLNYGGILATSLYSQVSFYRR